MSAAGATTKTTTTTTAAKAAGSKLEEWKNRYESAVGVIVGDIYTVVNTGVKDAKQPTKKSVHDAVSHCQQWRDNSKLVAKRVPTIPLPSAQQTWIDLIHASIAASSACVTALQHRSQNAVKRFDHNVQSAVTLGHRLIRQLASSSS